MENEMLRSDLEQVIELYERRLKKLLEMMKTESDKYASSVIFYGKNLLAYEEKISDHEKKRRQGMKMSASAMVNKILGTTQIDGQLINTSVVAIGFDETEVFAELRRELAAAESRVTIRGVLKPLADIKARNPKVEELYGKICAWASPEYVDKLSENNLRRIKEATDQKLSRFDRTMKEHYMRFAEVFGDMLERLFSNEDKTEDDLTFTDFCKYQTSLYKEFDLINRIDVRFDYTVSETEGKLSVNCDREYEKTRFIATKVQAYIVTGYPYGKDEFKNIFASAFSDYLVADETHDFKWDEENGPMPSFRYVYPISVFENTVVVMEPRRVGELSYELQPSDIIYEVHDSALSVSGLEKHGITDAVVLIGENEMSLDSETVSVLLDEIKDNNHVKAKLYTDVSADGKPIKVSLERGLHNITIVGICPDGIKKIRLPEQYIGDRITVKYSLKCERKLMSKADPVIKLKLHIDRDSGFEYIHNKRLPGIVVRAGTVAPLTRNHGTSVYEVEYVELKKDEKDFYEAELQSTASGVDPKKDRFNVFFTKDNAIYQLKDIGE